MRSVRRAAAAAQRIAVAFWRATAFLADRIWYNHPGFLMIAYIALIAVGRLAAHSAGRTSKEAGLAVAAWLALIWSWRVARGGHLSRNLLLLTTWYAIAASVFHLATWWDVQDAAVLVISTAQLALLLSPAAYLATREGMAVDYRAARRWLVPVAGGWRQDPWAEPARTALTLRLRPPWWVLPAALGTGLAVALACLLGTHILLLPHCVPRHLPPAAVPPARCYVHGYGFPLPVLLHAPIPGWHPLVAFAKNVVQWTVASLAVLQGVRLWWNRRPTYLPAAPPLTSAVPAA
jgi:hypothetical protein